MSHHQGLPISDASTSPNRLKAPRLSGPPTGPPDRRLAQRSTRVARNESVLSAKSIAPIRSPPGLPGTGPGWNRVAVARTGEPTPREVSEGRKRKQQQQQQFHRVPEKLASKKSDKRREHVEKMWDMTHLGPAVWIASDKSTLLPWLKKQPDQRPSGKKRTWRWLAAERKRFSGAQHPCIQLPSHPFRKNHSPKGGRGSDTQVHHGEEGPWCHEGGHGRVGRHAPPFRPCKETSRRLQKK